MQVVVCVWDPQHTLTRVEAQQRALKDGTLAKLVKKHGRSGTALEGAMASAALVSTTTSLRGDAICSECGSLCETVFSQDGIESKVEAVRDVAQNLDAAMQRTRSRR